jgi:hypothetical protein
VLARALAQRGRDHERARRLAAQARDDFAKVHEVALAREASEVAGDLGGEGAGALATPTRHPRY